MLIINGDVGDDGRYYAKAVNGAGTDGWFYGNASFFLTQVKALAIVVGYSFAMSYGIFRFINFVSPIRVTSEEEVLGLDATQHNEKYLQGTLLVKETGKMEEELVD